MDERYNLNAAKAWYAITYSASAVVYPFLMIYFKLCGFNQSQIGVLFAVRPWLTLVMGNVWAGIADYLHIHKPLFLLCYVLSSLFRFSICLTDRFFPALAICVLTELFAPPVGILMDASTMAASAAIPGGYGKIRMWGAIGWGGVSPLGGWIVTRYGMQVGFYGYLGLVIVGFVPAVLAPIQVLTHRCKEAQQAKQARLEQAQQYTPLDSSCASSTAAVKPTFAAIDLAHAQHPEAPHPDQLAGVKDPVFQLQNGMLERAGTDLAADARSAAHADGDGLDHSSVACHSHDQQQKTEGTAEAKESGGETENVSRGSGGVVRSWPSSSNLARNSGSAAGKSHAAAAALGLPGSSDHSRHVAARASRGSSSTHEADTPTFAGRQFSGASASPCSRSRHSLDDERGGVDPHLALQWAALEQLPLASEPVLQAFAPHVLHTPKSRRASMEDRGGLESVLLLPSFSEEASDACHLIPTEHTPADDLTAFERVIAVLRRPEVAIFLIMAVMFGYGMGTIDSFMFIYLRELGGTEFLMGLCIGTMCAAEAPLFHFAGPIFDYVGLERTLHIVMGVYIFRLCAYGSLELAGTPWAVLPIELLHGVTFGCAWAAGTLNCAHIAPRGLEATTQAIFNGMYMGVGLGSGGVIGGLVYDRYGARIVFFSAAAVITAGWLVVSAAQMVLRCRKQQKHHAGSQELQEPLLA